MEGIPNVGDNVVPKRKKIKINMCVYLFVYLFI